MTEDDAEDLQESNGSFMAAKMAASSTRSFSELLDSLLDSESPSKSQTLAAQPVPSTALDLSSPAALNSGDLLRRPLQLPGSCDWGLSHHLTGPANPGSGRPSPGSIESAAPLSSSTATAATAGALGFESHQASSRDFSVHQGNSAFELLQRAAPIAAALQHSADGKGLLADGRGVLADVSNSIGDVRGVVHDVSHQQCPAQQKQAQTVAEAPGTGSSTAAMSDAASPGAAVTEEELKVMDVLSGTDEHLKKWYSRYVALDLCIEERCQGCRPSQTQFYFLHHTSSSIKQICLMGPITAEV